MRLWKSQEKWPSDTDLRLWLKDRGYTWRNGNWYTCDGAIKHLEPEEILESQTRVTEDGVTFVTRDPRLSSDGQAGEPPPDRA